MTIQYKSDYTGALVTANRDGAQYTDAIVNGGTVYGASKGATDILTGYYVEFSSTNYRLQTANGWWIVLVPDSGWDLTTGYQKLYAHSDSQAQALVNKIIKNNATIVQHNILCARFADKLTTEQKKTLRQLQERLTARNNSLKENGMCSDVESSYPSGYAEMQQYLVDFMNSNQGVGVVISVSTLIYIVIAATVVAGLGTAAYYMYKELADESERDIKYSDELTAALQSKLTDEEYQQLLDETKGIVTKAKITSSLGSYGNVIKWAAVAAAGIMAYLFISKKIKER